MADASDEPGPPVPEASVPRRALGLLTLAGIAVRLAFLVLEPSTGPKGDEQVWVKLAHNVCDRSFSPLRTPMILFHPPLYPYFLAVPLCLTGSLAAVKVVQALVASLVIPAVGRVGSRLFGARAGLVAASLAAFYPELVWFAVHFWVENLFLVLVWWGLDRLLAADREGRLFLAMVAGLLWGLAVLARETSLYFAPLAALWLAWRRPRGVPRALVFLLATVVVVAPWTYRNWRVFRGFVPVSTAGGLNLFQGNATLTRQEVYDLYKPVEGFIEQYHYGVRMGLQAIRERQPAWAFEKLRDQMPMFWEAESMALIHVKRGAYGATSGRTAVVVALVMLLPYVVVLASFVAGLAGAALDRGHVLLLGFLVYYNALHVVTHGFNRYRLPVMPILFLFAGWAWQAWRSGRYPPLGPGRTVLAGVLAIGFTVTLVPSLRTQLHHPAFQGGPPEGEERLAPDPGSPDHPPDDGAPPR